MHATLAEILENQKSGLLWVTHDGIVRYANGDACSRTGLAGGSKLYDPDLVHAVERSALQRVSASLTVTGRPSVVGEAIPELRCRVVPGLAKDDAFVFLRDESSADAGIAYEWLVELGNPQRQDHEMKVLRHHLAHPEEGWPVHRGLALLADRVRRPDQVVAILCTCAEASTCHRTVVAEALRERLQILVQSWQQAPPGG